MTTTENALSRPRLGPVTLVAWEASEITFLARLYVQDNGEPERWNGWVCPAFDREQVDRLVAYNNATYAKEPETLVDTYEWDGNELVVTDHMYDGMIEREGPVLDDEGHLRWAIGAWSWTWYRVDCGCGHYYEEHDGGSCVGTAGQLGDWLLEGEHDPDEPCACTKFVPNIGEEATE